MGSDEYRDKFAIVGIGQTPTTRTHGEGKSAQQLEAWGARLAIEDAGLRREDIDGAIHVGPRGNGVDGYSRKIGLRTNFFIPIFRGGASTIEAILLATEAISTGNATNVLITVGTTAYSDTHSATKGEGNQIIRWSVGGDSQTGLEELGFYAAPGAATVHGWWASRHMHEYGTTPEQLGAVAMAGRAWANLNPEARFYEKKLTLDEYMNSRMVVHPYRLMDHCVMADAGAAFIVTSADRASHMRKQPIYIKGVGLGDGVREIWWNKTNYTQSDARHAGQVAMRQAGIKLSDIDLANFFDPFTIEMIFWAEDYGWCEKGEGGAFIESGATAPGGSIPMQTYGGLLSGYHIGDMGNIIESVRQLRGERGDNQIEGAEIAMANGSGGEYVLPYMAPINGTAIFGNTLS
ncbi:thiolase C-terminal domain-containing protein [Streptomyces sp. NPDC096311]|uniref:thiolase C-terminal domain-containing protein n=1 Tax=Streptomyces sp. NPDC096311 TaxID=3366083 RepID=UPI0037F3F84B